MESPPERPRYRVPRPKTRLGQLGLTVAAIVGGAYVIVLAAAPLDLSRQFLPEPLHLVVLVVYAAVVAYLLTWTATERGRRENLGRIVEWFGPYGLVLLPLVILWVSAFVWASFTVTLFTHGWLELAPGGAAEVTEGSLRDFYLWHLLDLVPFLEIPQTLRWEEPVVFAQTRVGWLVLLYQAVVVVPCIGAIGWYWKHRHSLPDESASAGLRGSRPQDDENG